MINTANHVLVTDKASNALKLTGLMAGAATATFSLFVVMSKLVEDGASYQTPVEQPFQVIISTVKEDSDTNKIKPPLPKPPEVKAMPKPAVEPQSSSSENSLQIDGGGFEMHAPNVDTGYAKSGEQNFSAMPIVRVPPNYPQKAAIEGIEGWVNMSFSINEFGKVINVQVVDAEPKRIFNTAAKKALRKWKYKPRMVNGKPVVQEGQYVVLEFKMDN